MVTIGEFTQHMVVSLVAMLLAVGVLALAARRWDDAHSFLRKALWAIPIMLWLVAVLSLTATITEARCTDNPREFCRFNDNIPLMATVVFIYVAMVLGRAVMAYLYRPLTSGGLFEDRAVVDERA